MFDKSTEVKHKLITFAIREDEEMDFLNAYESIEELIRDEKKIPGRLIKTFLSFVRDPKKLYGDRFKEKAIEVIANYKSRFEKFEKEAPSFLFEYTIEKEDPDALMPPPGDRHYEENWQPPKRKVVYSWQEMVEKVSISYLTACISESTLQEKKGAIIFHVTREVNNYLKHCPDQIRKNLILSYRQAIVSCLCNELRGLKLWYSPNPNIKKMASGVRHYYNIEMTKKEEKPLTTSQSLFEMRQKFHVITGKGFNILIKK